MVEIRREIRFLLNDESVTLDSVGATRTLLDYLRLERRLCGTKEGCAEGDCGACTVLVGRVARGNLVYETVNACIRFVASLDGCHVVTIEHLAGKEGHLHPVQQAMVDEHGSQCGFCTPGIVMSLYRLWMSNPNPDDAAVNEALQGNLCRCTGYEAIIRATKAISRYGAPEDDPLYAERETVLAKLDELNDGARVECGSDNDSFVLPASLDDLAEILRSSPEATIVAGATDVGLWVTKHMRDIAPVVFVSHLAELKKITEGVDGLTIGAGVTYTEMGPVIAWHYPQLASFWSRIGGQQVRNMGTIGGNIANGSPIGDTPPALIALDATVTLRLGKERRTLPLEDFFVAYGKQDRRPSEFVETIHLPYVAEKSIYAVHKISKRFDEDISSVCGAFNLTIEDGVVTGARIAYGGMAATPKRATAVEKALVGSPWTLETVERAMVAYDADFAPISDWRASADYRALVARNLLKRVFIEATEGAEAIRLPGKSAA